MFRLVVLICLMLNSTMMTQTSADSSAAAPFDALRASVLADSSSASVPAGSSDSLGSPADSAAPVSHSDSASDVADSTSSHASTVARAAWFLVLITVLPVLYCCCLTWGLWHIVSPPSEGGAGGFFQPSTSWAGQGSSLGGGGGGWGQQGPMKQQSPGCNVV